MHIGIIGLGAMGSAMSQKLLKSGYAVTGFDIRAECIAELESGGGHGVTSARDVAKISDVVITSLNNAEIFHTVTTGENGLIHDLRPNAVVVDTCTLSVADES